MNTEKVFTAFNKEGQEILLYRKDEDIYIDLLSDKMEIYDKDKIDLRTLINANKSLNLRKHMLTALIKRKYNKDRSKLVYTENILLGTEFIVRELERTRTDSGYRIHGIPCYDYQYDFKNEKSGNISLFEFKREDKINYNVYSIYTNLFDKKEYIVFKNSLKNLCKLPSFGEGMKYIYVNGVSLEDVINEKVIEKKKVYEYAYEARKYKLTD